MALKDSENKYYKIGKVVGFNDTDSVLSVILEEYKDQSTRENFTDYDKKISHQVGIKLDSVDVQTFVSKIYDKIKEQAPYSSMSDVL